MYLDWIHNQYTQIVPRCKRESDKVICFLACFGITIIDNECRGIWHGRTTSTGNGKYTNFKWRRLKIAGLAALETPGIAAMSGGLSEGWAKRLSGKNVQKGVTVEVGQLEAAVDLRIIVLYETPIHEVCRMLQQNVREAVESMTGLHIVEVNVKVEGVAFKNDEIS